MDYDKALEIYEDLVADYDDLAVKGAANKYTSMNGNMFSFLNKDDATLCLRYSEADKAAYNEANGTSDVISYGAVMRGYVVMTPEIMADEAALKDHFARCVEHARMLKPKPTKKARK